METDLTESSISQLERGKTTGSIGTLQRIGAALGITLGDLFESPNAHRSVVVDFQDLPMQEYGKDATKTLITPRYFDHVEVFVGHLAPGGHTGQDQVAYGSSEELIVVLQGAVDVTLGEETYRVGTHQSAPIYTNTPHKIQATEDGPAMVMWVIAPPSTA